MIQNSNNIKSKYIKGYTQNVDVNKMSTDLNIDKNLIQNNLESNKMDSYDPYHTSDSKKEIFWFYSNNSNMDGKAIQSEYDENTNTFKRGLGVKNGFNDSDFWFEDPLIPTFELYFDDESPFFKNSNNIDDNNYSQNSFKSFIKKYSSIDNDGYNSRLNMWSEFNNIFFKIFEKAVDSQNINKKNKQYYITKISGLNLLNKKMINYGEDKITITLNEDVSMISWYLVELYNNIIYSYKNQRYMFPDNVLRFNLIIKINDIRNFQIPQSNNTSSLTNNIDKNNITNGNIKNVISPKSQIIYTLHDCNFNFFESRNYDDEMVVGGYGESMSNTPSKISFDIIFKSVTRTSNFPLIDSKFSSITPWESALSVGTNYTKDNGTFDNYFDSINKIKQNVSPDMKQYSNELLSKGIQSSNNINLDYVNNVESLLRVDSQKIKNDLTNISKDYFKNIENKLRTLRGSVVNNLLTQIREKSHSNKIEPDNIYLQNFNNRISITNLGKEIGSSILNNLEDAARQATNF